MNTHLGVNPALYVLLGCPGSGKGTFAQAIQSEGYVHISTGDIAREEVRNETAFGLEYKEAILNHVKGRIPFEKIQELVEQRLEKAISEQKGVILDGYPKTIDQCELLDTLITEKGLNERVVIVFIDVKEDDAIDRILCRQTCEKCNKIYKNSGL